MTDSIRKKEIDLSLESVLKAEVQDLQSLLSHVDRGTDLSEHSNKAFKTIRVMYQSRMNNVTELHDKIDLAIEIYQNIGFQLRALNQKYGDSLNADLRKFYLNMEAFLMTVLNSELITKTLLEHTQERRKVDPYYFPNTLPSFISPPKPSEDKKTFIRRRLLENMQLKALGKTISLTGESYVLERKAKIALGLENSIEEWLAKVYQNKDQGELLRGEQERMMQYLDHQEVRLHSPITKETAHYKNPRDMVDRVDYYDNTSRQLYRKFITHGKLFECVPVEGNPFLIQAYSTENKKEKSKAREGYAAVVINTRGEFYSGTHLSHYYEGLSADHYRYHSSFMSGLDVLFAGEIKTDSEGNLIEINNQSGHYKTNLESLYEAVQFLHDKGVDFSKAEIVTYHFTLDGRNIFSYDEFIALVKIDKLCRDLEKTIQLVERVDKGEYSLEMRDEISNTQLSKDLQSNINSIVTLLSTKGSLNESDLRLLQVLNSQLDSVWKKAGTLPPHIADDEVLYENLPKEIINEVERIKTEFLPGLKNDILDNYLYMIFYFVRYQKEWKNHVVNISKNESSIAEENEVIQFSEAWLKSFYEINEAVTQKINACDRYSLHLLFDATDILLDPDQELETAEQTIDKVDRCLEYGKYYLSQMQLDDSIDLIKKQEMMNLISTRIDVLQTQKNFLNQAIADLKQANIKRQDKSLDRQNESAALPPDSLNVDTIQDDVKTKKEHKSFFSRIWKFGRENPGKTLGGGLLFTFVAPFIAPHLLAVGGVFAVKSLVTLLAIKVGLTAGGISLTSFVGAEMKIVKRYLHKHHHFFKHNNPTEERTAASAVKESKLQPKL